jgi:hypothetical protein
MMNMDEFTAPISKPKAKRKKILIGIILILLITAAAGSYKLFRTAALPAQVVNIADTLNYSVYYPSKLPGGYSYTDGSANLKTGLFYYKLHNGKKTITVTQQPVLGTIDLRKLPKYSSLNVPAGPAAIGVSVGNPSVVIATGSTLVNINSSKGVSRDSVIAVARKIKAIDTNSTD